MGFLSTITIKNDRLHEFKENPAEFARIIFEGIDKANELHKSVSLEGGYLGIQPSRHADDTTVYVHMGNTVFDLHYYGKDFEDLAARSPKVLKKFINEAQWFVTQAKKELKKIESQKDLK